MIPPLTEEEVNQNHRSMFDFPKTLPFSRILFFNEYCHNPQKRGVDTISEEDYVSQLTKELDSLGMLQTKKVAVNGVVSLIQEEIRTRQRRCDALYVLPEADMESQSSTGLYHLAFIEKKIEKEMKRLRILDLQQTLALTKLMLENVRFQMVSHLMQPPAFCSIISSAPPLKEDIKDQDYNFFLKQVNDYYLERIDEAEGIVTEFESRFICNFIRAAKKVVIREWMKSPLSTECEQLKLKRALKSFTCKVLDSELAVKDVEHVDHNKALGNEKKLSKDLFALRKLDYPHIVRILEKCLVETRRKSMPAELITSFESINSLNISQTLELLGNFLTWPEAQRYHFLFLEIVRIHQLIVQENMLHIKGARRQKVKVGIYEMKRLKEEWKTLELFLDDFEYVAERLKKMKITKEV